MKMSPAGLTISCVVGLVLVACGGGGTPGPAATGAASGATAAVTKDITFRIGHAGTNTSLLEMDAQDFIKRVTDASAGKARGTSFPNSQLGKQQEMVEQVQLGALEMVVSSSEFVSIVPEFGIFDLPFAFKDRAEVKKAVEGPLGAELTKAAAGKNLVVLGFWENGYRQITTSKRAIKVPDDLKGLKIRTPPNPDRVKMFKLWGANAAPLDFSELFSALQTGTFDGQENPLAQITSAKLHEVQKYLSLSGHVYTPTYLLASKPWYEGLEPAAQKLLRELAVQVGDGSRSRGAKFDSDGIEIVKKAGVQVNDDVDKAAFQRTGQELYDDFQKKFGPNLLDLYHKSIGR
jgi:tripartite ATP-independent transporter DctP family solute receptor